MQFRQVNGEMKSINSNVNSKSVQTLIQLGYCQPSDIKRAMIDGDRLSSPEYTARIRQLERQLKMLGESNRIKILLLLSKREMCVCELESALKLPQPTISHHVGLLEHAGLLERSQERQVCVLQTECFLSHLETS